MWCLGIVKVKMIYFALIPGRTFFWSSHFYDSLLAVLSIYKWLSRSLLHVLHLKGINTHINFWFFFFHLYYWLLFLLCLQVHPFCQMRYLKLDKPASPRSSIRSCFWTAFHGKRLANSQLGIEKETRVGKKDTHPWKTLYIQNDGSY